MSTNPDPVADRYRRIGDWQTGTDAYHEWAERRERKSVERIFYRGIEIVFDGKPIPNANRTLYLNPESIDIEQWKLDRYRRYILG